MENSVHTFDSLPEFVTNQNPLQSRWHPPGDAHAPRCAVLTVLPRDMIAGIDVEGILDWACWLYKLSNARELERI